MNEHTRVPHEGGHAAQDDRAMRCQICGEEMSRASAYACSRCGAPHHQDCFSFNEGRCAIFGCGHGELTSFQNLPATLQHKEMTITEATRPEFSLAPVLESLKRKALTRSKDLPKTLGAGLFGSVLTMFGFWLFVGSAARDGMLWLGLLFCGLGPGLLAPFVAPSQHRRPMMTTAITGVAFFTFYAMRLVHLDWRFFWSSMTVAAGILFATSIAEAVFGKLTALGQALGTAGSPVRHLASWGFFMLAIMAGAITNGEMLSTLAYKEISVLSVLALVAAVPALEMGKEEHRKRERLQGTPSSGQLPPGR